MATDYAQYTHQEMIILQLDLEKAYDPLNWFAVSWLMHTLSFTQAEW